MGVKAGDTLVRIRELATVAFIAGVLTGLLVLPYTLMGGLSVRAANRGFQSLPADMVTPALPQGSVILAANGAKLATFYYENRVEVPITQVAPIMRKAIVAIEDSRFYEHGALDVKGTIRAVIANLRAGEVIQGGSTLSQ